MANSCIIFLDQGAQQIGVRIVDGAGNVLATAPSIAITLGDLSPDHVARTAKFRLFRWKDADAGCAVKQAYILMTEPE